MRLFYLGISTGVLILVLAKEGGSGFSVFRVAWDTWQYWLIVLLTIPYFGTITYLAGKWFVSKHRKKQKIGYRYVRGDIERKTFLLPLLSTGIGIGIGSGFLGIGGGLVAGPILLELQLYLSVSVATLAFMTLSTASSTTTQFLIISRIQSLTAL